MSRCFPFPPPGYEKKAKRDDVGLLKKDREKKHKKEKKDRKKREGKGKREKDRSDGKHRDKKDKKEKHRDKKEKDRHKDKDKSCVSDEKRLPGSKCIDGDKPSDGKRLPGKPKDSNGDKALDEKKLLGQFNRHDIRDKTLDVRKFPGKPGGNGGGIFTQKQKQRGVDKNSISGERNQFSGYNGQKHSQNSNYAQHAIDPEFVQESGRRTKDEDRHHFIEKFTGTDVKRDEGMVRLEAKAPGTWVEGKEKNKKSDDRALKGQAVRDGPSFIGSAQSFSKTIQTKIDGMPRLLEKDIGKKMEEKEKVKEKEGDDRHGGKLMDKDKEEKGKGKDKEKKKEDKTKQKSEQKNTEPDKLKEDSKADLVGNHIVKTSHPPNDSSKSAVAEGNVKKRKDSDTNGFLHANDIKANKLPRHTSFLHQWTENGRLLETHQTSTPSAPGRKGAVDSPVVDNKEHKKNGLIEAQALSIFTMQSVSLSLAKPSHAAQADEIAEVSRKQPHPDSEYLNEVVQVSKMEECFDFDDEDWLLQSSNSQGKKPKVGSAGVDETPQVWSEALQIESADVCALPYVIPY